MQTRTVDCELTARIRHVLANLEFTVTSSEMPRDFLGPRGLDSITSAGDMRRELQRSSIMTAEAHTSHGRCRSLQMPYPGVHPSMSFYDVVPREISVDGIRLTDV